MKFRLTVDLTEQEYRTAWGEGIHILNTAVDKNGNPLREMMGGSYNESEKRKAARLYLEQAIKDHIQEETKRHDF